MGEQMIPAGWYPDPTGDATKLRWWDGANWADSTCNVWAEPVPHERQTTIAWPGPNPYQQQTPHVWAPPSMNTIGSDEYLCALYIEGKKGGQKPEMAKKALKKGYSFSWFAVLTGPIYFVYRKCYIEAAVIIAVIVALAYLPFELPSLIDRVLYVAYGALFYPFYRIHMKRAIVTARQEGLDEAALQKLRRRGGTNLGLALGLGAVVLLLLVLVIYLMFTAV